MSQETTRKDIKHRKIPRSRMINDFAQILFGHVLRKMHGAIFGPITICLRLESVELSVQFFFQASFVFSKLQHGQIQDMWYKLQPMTQKNELKT